MQTSPANTNPFPWNSFPDRLVHFFHLSAKNFSIFATLPSGCSRVSIFHFVGRNRATMATLHRSPSLANKRVEGVERAEGKKEKKNKGAGPRTRWKMWRDRRLPLSSPLPAQSRRYMNCHGRTLNASHPPRGNLFGHRNDGTYGTPSIETGPCAFQRY